MRCPSLTRDDSSWSYVVNFTPIGNAVFITMDISDAFLAVGFSFPQNWKKMEFMSWHFRVRTSSPNVWTISTLTPHPPLRSHGSPSCGGKLVQVRCREMRYWRDTTLDISYGRHYLNLRILWDVYHDFDLIPYVGLSCFGGSDLLIFIFSRQ